MNKNKIVLWDKTNKLAELTFEPYDIDTITLAESQLNDEIEKAFTKGLAEVHIARYDEKGACKIRTLANNLKPKEEYEYIFDCKSSKIIDRNLNAMKSGIFNTILRNNGKCFDDDYEFIREVVEELILRGHYKIGITEYHFEKKLIKS